MAAIIPGVDRNTVFVEAGLVALRDEKGDFQNPRTLFLAASREELSADGLLRSGQEQIDDIGQVLAAKFRAYLDGVKAVERLQQKGRNR